MRPENNDQDTFSRLIGLGEKSIKKSYYPQLQKKIEELEKSERRYRLLADNISDVIWILDLDLTYQYVSASIERLSGFRPDELKEKPFTFLLHPESAERFSSRIRQLLEQESFQNGTPHEIELQLRHRDSSLRWIEISISLSHDQIAAGPRLLGISRDITSRRLAEEERHQYQEQLLQAQKMESIGTLTGGIAHDFNNLLTVINGYSDKLLRSMPSDHPYHHDISSINQAGKKAADLTRRLLGFSRKQQFTAEPVDINRTISAMNDMLRRLIGEDITVTTNLTKPLPMIKADNSQLEQIFTNLIINARDALKGVKDPDREKTIVIETGRSSLDEKAASAKGLAKAGEYVYISVSDNGCGIPEELCPRIFEPFFTTKAKNEGTGLGLSTVYGIVKQNQGSILVFSKPHSGTQFIIYWPVTSEAHELKSMAQPSEATVTGSETILVVEDDEDVCLFTHEALKSLGYTVHAVHSAAVALNRIRMSPGLFDLIVTDLVLPGMNGVEFIRMARRIVPGIKAIFVSGYMDNQVIEEQTINTAVNFLQKPYNVRTLAEKVREILGHKPL